MTALPPVQDVQATERAIRAGLNQAAARAIVSHLDTLGAQVKRVQDNGRLELVPIGSWSARTQRSNGSW